MVARKSVPPNKQAISHLQHVPCRSRVIIVLGICDILNNAHKTSVFDAFMNLTSTLTRRSRTDYIVFSVPIVPQLQPTISDTADVKKQKQRRRQTVDSVNQLLQRNYGPRFVHFEPEPQMYDDDGVHLNEEGNLAFAAVINQCVLKTSVKTVFRSTPTKHCLFFDASKVFFLISILLRCITREKCTTPRNTCTSV